MGRFVRMGWQWKKAYRNRVVIWAEPEPGSLALEPNSQNAEGIDITATEAVKQGELR